MHSLDAILALVLSLAQDPPKSSEYASWSSFETGASTSYRQEGELSGKKVDARLTYRLIETTAKRVLLDQTVTWRDGGGGICVLFGRTEIPAWASRVRRPRAAGEEDLKVAGRTVRCRWVESEEGPGLRMKEWVSREVPGGLVRREVTSEGDRPARTVLRLESWKGDPRRVD